MLRGLLDQVKQVQRDHAAALDKVHSDAAKLKRDVVESQRKLDVIRGETSTATTEHAELQARLQNLRAQVADAEEEHERFDGVKAAQQVAAAQHERERQAAAAQRAAAAQHAPAAQQAAAAAAQQAAAAADHQAAAATRRAAAQAYHLAQMAAARRAQQVRWLRSNYKWLVPAFFVLVIALYVAYVQAIAPSAPLLDESATTHAAIAIALPHNADRDAVHEVKVCEKRFYGWSSSWKPFPTLSATDGTLTFSGSPHQPLTSETEYSVQLRTAGSAWGGAATIFTKLDHVKKARKEEAARAKKRNRGKCLNEIDALIEGHPRLLAKRGAMKAHNARIETLKRKAAAKRTLAETTLSAGRKKARGGDYNAGREADAAHATLLLEAAAIEKNIKAVQSNPLSRQLAIDLKKLERALKQAPALEMRRFAEVHRLKKAVRRHVDRGEYDQAEALGPHISAHEDIAKAFGKVWAASWKPECAAHVVIPYGVTEIPEYAFERCTSLTAIVIPDSVTTIGPFAFAHCTSLTTASIPSGATLEKDTYGGEGPFWNSPTTVTTRG